MYKLECMCALHGFAAQKLGSFWLQLFTFWLQRAETYPNCSNKPALSIFEPIV